MRVRRSFQVLWSRRSCWEFNKHLKMKRLLFTLLLAAFATCTYVTSAECMEVATAEVEDCVINESGFHCDKKVVVSTLVSYGVQTVLEAVQVTTIQKDGEPTALEETVEIEIEKSQPQISYPLKFIHTVPYYPYEEVIKVKKTRRGHQECEDSPHSINPTCGWTYQGSTKIEDSQGFCCDKSIRELVRSKWDDSLWRGEKELGETPTFRNSFSTAHCMRTGELYFHGYEIGESSEYYEIKFKIKKGDDNLEFTLTPADPFIGFDQAGGWKLKAESDGGSDKPRDTPDLSNYILYIPASPDTHPFVQDYQHNMLLVPREEVSIDGSECNKVGVSFRTFRSQANSCQTSEAGDCLHNQLFHKHNSDLEKLIVNKDAETTYLLHGKKVFKGSMEFSAGMKKVLQYRIPDIDYTRVSLTMDLDTLKVVSTESLGIIRDASVKSFDSMSSNGTLVAQIQNYGDLETDYVVTVTNCNMNIVEAIPAQSRILDPLEQAVLNFDIHTAYNLDTTNECLVQLTSPTGRFYDEILVKFDTFKHQSKFSWELQEKNKGTKVTK